MTLSELLQPELVLAKAEFSSKDELIAHLVERIYNPKTVIPIPQNDLLRTIQMREKIGGTLLPSGLSIPHARLKDFEGLVIALGIPVKPIPCEGIQIKMMALMVSSQSGGIHYLPTLAALTKISRDQEFFSLLCGAESSESFIRILKGKDPNLG